MAYKFKTYTISELVNRLAKASDTNRYDQVTRNVHQIFAGKMEQRADAIIMASELRDTFSTFAGMNPQSNFRDVFADAFEENTVDTPEGAKQHDESVFARDETVSDDFRPLAIEYKADPIDDIKASSLLEIQKVVASSVDNPQYRFNGYTKVAELGGFANWNVSFNTAKGTAEINVPVAFVENLPYSPDKFSSVHGNHEFTTANLKDFARAYAPVLGAKVTSNSGLEYLGTQSVIPEGQFHSDVSEDLVAQMGEIAFGESTIVDEANTANLDETEQAITTSIINAREVAVGKLSRDASGKPVTNSIQIAYAGSVKYEDMPNDKNNFNGVIAFNASKKNKFGERSITIPVEIKGDVIVAENFMDQAQKKYDLNATAVDGFFNAGEELEGDEIETEAFSDAFLTSDATYNELRRDMKASIDGGNIARANATIKAISKRFSDETVKAAMNDYIHFVKEATECKNNATNCQTCPFYESPNRKNASHTVPYCNKLGAAVTQVKRGSVPGSNCVKRSSSILWDTEHDAKYSGVMNSSSISMS